MQCLKGEHKNLNAKYEANYCIEPKNMTNKYKTNRPVISHT